MTKAVHHYGNLFSFPRHWVLLSLLVLSCMGGSIIAFTIIDFDGISRGSTFALQVLIIPIVVVDVILRETITKNDTIIDLRRSTALSLVICMVWITMMIVGSTMQVTHQLPKILYRVTFFCICVTVAIRFLVFSTVTQLSLPRLIVSIVAQPIALIFSTTIFWNSWTPQIMMATLASSAILVIATQLLIRTVNQQGEVIVGIGAIPLFKGFLANWLEGFTYPLEGYFEKLGTTTDVDVNVFAFRGENKLKAMIVIPNIHPGPFRNLGSSDLPGMIQRSFETKFKVITAVPHGMSGHELDLTSQLQCDRVIKAILEIDLSNFINNATKCVRIDTGLAQATCQLLGDAALVTVTRAPNNMEDIPLSVGMEIIRKGELIGAKQVAVIDAHNSILGPKEASILSKEEEQALVNVAHITLTDALKEEKQPFLMGVAKVVPSEFLIDQGMGPGGIIAIAIVVGGQKTVYITIDGNNMVSGLREKIIQTLSDRFDECEVLSTDTHVVNAISTMERGYYPLGEAMNHEQLISYIQDVAGKALDGLEKTRISFTKVHIKNVRVIGEEKIANLSMLIDRTYNVVKRMTPLIYLPATFFALIPFLLI